VPPRTRTAVHALGARHWHTLLRGAYVGLVRGKAAAIATPANLARHAGFLPHPLGAPRANNGQPAPGPGVGLGRSSQEPGAREWLAMLWAPRPSPVSAAPFPSWDGPILRRATTLLLAQTAQESVHDSARQPESFGHHHMDMARPGAAVRRAQLLQELSDRLGVRRSASGEALALVPARPVRRWRRLRRACQPGCDHAPRGPRGASLVALREPGDHGNDGGWAGVLHDRDLFG
jgi:hypothetical protein